MSRTAEQRPATRRRSAEHPNRLEPADSPQLRQDGGAPAAAPRGDALCHEKTQQKRVAS